MRGESGDGPRAGREPDDDVEIIVRPRRPVAMEMGACAAGFVVWLREMGLAGCYTAAQLADLIEWYYHDNNIERVPDHQGLMTLVRCQPGVMVERTRRPYMAARWVPEVPPDLGDNVNLVARPIRPFVYTIEASIQPLPAGLEQPRRAA